MHAKRAGLFTFFFTDIIYAKAAIMQVKNLIIKLPYTARTEALEFLDFNPRIEIIYDRNVAANKIRLPTISTD